MTERASRAAEARQERPLIIPARLLTLSLAAVAGPGVLTSACGGSSGEEEAQADETTTTGIPASSSASSVPTAAGAYAECMREHGVPDFPVVDSQGLPGFDERRERLDRPSPAFRAADEACDEPRHGRRAAGRRECAALVTVKRRRGRWGFRHANVTDARRSLPRGPGQAIHRLQESEVALMSAGAATATARRSWLVGASLLTIGVLGLGLFASACGGSSPGDGVAQVDSTGATTTGPASGERRSGNPIAFAACMRKNGVSNFPDPDPSKGMQVVGGPGLDPTSPRFKAAEEACRRFLPKGGKPDPQQEARIRAAVLKYSACMRRNGVPKFPDPDTGAGLPSIALGGSSGIDPKSPQFKAANEACRKLLPGGGRGGSLNPSESDQTP
jgi:hypothetical protein